MIPQALFSLSAHPRFMFRGAIVSLGLVLLVATNPVYSQDQTGGVQTAAPSASRTAPGSRSILKQGSRGDSVADLQALLKLLGFYVGAIDGVYQDSTTSAVAAFQQAAGLQADGIVGLETWTRLLPPSPLVNAATSASATPTPSGGGAIANNSSTTSSSSSFPSPTTSPPVNRSMPSPTAQASSTSVIASNSTPAAPAAQSASPQPPAAQTPSPQSPSPQSPTPQTSTSTSVDLPILRVGMRGSAVNSLQERLKALGAFKGAIDGVFGSETQEAVKTAQRNFNLEPDGIVGPATWAALLR